MPLNPAPGVEHNETNLSCTASPSHSDGLGNHTLEEMARAANPKTSLRDVDNVLSVDIQYPLLNHPNCSNAIILLFIHHSFGQCKIDFASTTELYVLRERTLP